MNKQFFVGFAIGAVVSGTAVGLYARLAINEIKQLLQKGSQGIAKVAGKI